MAFKLKGGKRVAHSKWSFDDESSTWKSRATDGNDGFLIQTIIILDSGKCEARVQHNGHHKFTKDLVSLSTEVKLLDHLDAAKQWCRTKSNSLAARHDSKIEMKPDDFRTLSQRTASGPLSPGSAEDFGPAQRPTPKFRTRKKRE
jgi:hypothetical protein